MSKYVLSIKPREYKGLRPTVDCKPTIVRDVIVDDRDPEERTKFVNDNESRGLYFLYVTDADVLTVNGVEPPAQYYYKGSKMFLAIIAVKPTVDVSEFTVDSVYD